MNLHEHQAKALLAAHGIPVPSGMVLESISELSNIPPSDTGWVVKAQAHTGGRGKAGGVKLVSDAAALKEAVTSLLGSRLVTNQTGPEGLPVDRLLVEPLTPIERECYLSLLLDRQRRRIAVVASAAGGMDIEAVAHDTPERIVTEIIDPVVGLMPYQVRRIVSALGPTTPVQTAQLRDILQRMYELYLGRDASLIEINPLVITQTGRWLALDAKLSIDDNALFRHKELAALRDEHQEHPIEAEARRSDLSYVRLGGDIGCMVNGAGLAMATMDLIRHLGGNPANFLDVGGTASAERVTKAFRLIMAEGQVRTVLVNIFGGIVRCDLIAEGIIAAVREAGLKVPVVARLRGANAEQGRQLLEQSGLDIHFEPDLAKAAALAIARAQGAAT